MRTEEITNEEYRAMRAAQPPFQPDKFSTPTDEYRLLPLNQRCIDAMESLRVGGAKSQDNMIADIGVLKKHGYKKGRDFYTDKVGVARRLETYGRINKEDAWCLVCDELIGNCKCDEMRVEMGEHYDSYHGWISDDV